MVIHFISVRDPCADQYRDDEKFTNRKRSSDSVSKKFPVTRLDFSYLFKKFKKKCRFRNAGGGDAWRKGMQGGMRNRGEISLSLVPRV